MKTNKALIKRFKFTRNKKMMHRSPGQNHFLAKQSGDKTRSHRNQNDFWLLAKTLRKIIPA